MVKLSLWICSLVTLSLYSPVDLKRKYYEHNQGSGFLDVQYGDDPEQVMDVFLPDGEITKVIILLHGGAWVVGSKDDMVEYVLLFRRYLPYHAIVNMNYRLGSKDSPGFPKQLEDIELAIETIKLLRPKYTNDITYAFMGVSAGAHLSMLYAYCYDVKNKVKVVVDIVGPVDFTTWDYSSNLFFYFAIMPFVGPYFYWENPGIYYTLSPITWINTTSAKTIGFYGDKDPLIAIEQATLLNQRLDHAKVVNEIYVYPGSHGDWEEKYQQDMRIKIITFLRKYFSIVT